MVFALLRFRTCCAETMRRWAVAAVGALAVACAAAVAEHSEVSQSAPDCVNKPLLWPAQCANLTAPATFDVKFSTDVGNFTMHVQREWSPYGADRFYSLSKFGYWGGAASGYLHGNDGGFFRVVPGFVVQWGIAGNVPVSAPWANAVIPNDPVVLSNIRGTVSYAAEQDANGMAFNRTTQIYINFGNNSRLDGMGFTPFATITEADMAVVDRIYAGYGQDPDQDSIYAQGDAYLRANYPLMTYTRATELTTP